MTYDRSRNHDSIFEFARQHIDELREDATRGREYRRAGAAAGSNRDPQPKDASHDYGHDDPFGGSAA